MKGQAGDSVSSSLLLVVTPMRNECLAGAKPRLITVVAASKPAPIVVLVPQATEAEQWAAEELATGLLLSLLRGHNGSEPMLIPRRGVRIALPAR